MYQIDNATAVASEPTPGAAGTPGYFTGGNPGTGTPATIVDADWLNMIQDELANIVTSAGLTPTKGTNTQVLAAIKTNFRARLTAPANFYVATTGNDSTGTGASGSPWATLQHAYNQVASMDLNGFTATINVADGTYTAGVLASGQEPGQGNPASIVFKGDLATPDNCIVSIASGAAFTAEYGAAFTVRGFKIIAGGSSGYGLFSFGQGAVIVFDTVDFGACGGGHVVASSGGNISVSGNYTISGNAPSHYAVNGPSQIGQGSSGLTITLSGSPVFAGGFASATACGIVGSSGQTFSGSAGATTARYSATLNGVINTSGGGANYFPGTTAGSTATGGQYA